MKVQIIDKNNMPIDILNIGHSIADFEEYTNKITGKPDPKLVYSPTRFCHMSTVLQYGLRVCNAKTGEEIKVKNLSPFSGSVDKIILGLK